MDYIVQSNIVHDFKWFEFNLQKNPKLLDEKVPANITGAQLRHNDSYLQVVMKQFR